jgi:hypothetical protein
MLMYFLINLHFQYPDWYLNEAIKTIVGVTIYLISIVQVIVNILVILNIFRGNYKEMMDDYFDLLPENPIAFIMGFIINPIFATYEIISRFFDKHFTIKNNER